MMSTAGVDIAAGAARRRRERRLRSWLKHERMTVAMALAEASHRTAPRGQRTARAGVWGHELNYTATVRDPPHTPAGALQPLRRRARRVAAGQDSYLVRAARAGSAAHRGPDRRRRSWVTDARYSCAADGGTAGGCAPVRRCSCACFRAGYLSAQDHPREHPSATLGA